MSDSHHDDLPTDGTAPQRPAESNSTTPSTTPRTATGWGAAPARTATDTVEPQPAPYVSGHYARPEQYGQAPQPEQPRRPDAGWNQYGAAPVGPTPWYGSASTKRRGGPRPPWFWPVIAIAVGLVALLAGGGVGFAIGHAIGANQSQSTSQFPGQGSNGFPGQGGGTNQFPGQNGGTGSGSSDGSTGSGSTGSGSTGTSGSTSNS